MDSSFMPPIETLLDPSFTAGGARLLEVENDVAQGDAKTPTNGMVNSWLKTVTSNAEFEKPVTTHAFRHFALHVVFRKGGLDATRMVAGHASLRVTRGYLAKMLPDHVSWAAFGDEAMSPSTFERVSKAAVPATHHGRWVDLGQRLERVLRHPGLVQSREWQARIRDQVATEFATVAFAPPDLREQYEEAAGEYAKVFKRVGALDIQQFEILLHEVILGGTEESTGRTKTQPTFDQTVWQQHLCKLLVGGTEGFIEAFNIMKQVEGRHLDDCDGDDEDGVENADGDSDTSSDEDEKDSTHDAALL
ncbi:uncharacterized protein EHS24_004305 [Apiotrichum porosum]|uniref:Uncharacterized protein n=1 Tax=Apiotrichum porosum TaxID=105984 RepID=A0A427Y4S1_9TREE|nr:uncharacterized protein EHS24_004305 [Apiotrichum porosum]RSH86084.1 hypothetical protein EHS24_004305 [Apiotrichum porosum]